MDSKYFDYNATTPLRLEAREEWLRVVDDCWLNPSSPYRAAAAVRVQLESAREKLGALLKTPSKRIVFNSGATEGNNAVFAHWANSLPEEARIGVSPTEHPSVLESAVHYFKGRIEWLKLDDKGAVNPEKVQSLLEKKDCQVSAISVMAANNETGILNDWLAIAAICSSRAVQYHCDASQWIGKLPLEGLANCDFVTGCAHKFGGPRGVGFGLLPKEQTSFKSLFGGYQEEDHRGGTEDVAGVLSMVAALSVAEAGDAKGSDLFLSKLGEGLPQIEIVGENAERLWNTVMLILPDFENVRWIRMLEKRGFLISSGSACSTGKQGPSKVLAAMGFDADAMRRAVRISSGWATDLADWEQLTEAFFESYDELRAGANNLTTRVVSI